MTTGKLIMYIILFIAVILSCLLHIFLDFRYHNKLHDKDINLSEGDIKNIRSELFWAGWMWALLTLIFIAREYQAWIN